jgi:RNA polymerase sigma-70 factor (ECF subfamily)
LSEEQRKALMLRSLSGDALAYRELLLQLADVLRVFFQRRMNDHAIEAEDLTQETLLAIHLKRETYHADLPLTCWVFAIARHKLTDWYRRKNFKCHVPLSDAEAIDTFEEFDGLLAERDITRILQDLPEKQAAAIRCMKLNGMSAGEAAEQTGQTVSAVKVSVHRGLRKLFARYGRISK